MTVESIVSVNLSNNEHSVTLLDCEQGGRRSIVIGAAKWWAGSRVDLWGTKDQLIALGIELLLAANEIPAPSPQRVPDAGPEIRRSGPATSPTSTRASGPVGDGAEAVTGGGVPVDGSPAHCRPGTPETPCCDVPSPRVEERRPDGTWLVYRCENCGAETDIAPKPESLGSDAA